MNAIAPEVDRILKEEDERWAPAHARVPKRARDVLSKC
jgi:hypothetical protein